MPAASSPRPPAPTGRGREAHGEGAPAVRFRCCAAAARRGGATQRGARTHAIHAGSAHRWLLISSRDIEPPIPLANLAAVVCVRSAPVHLQPGMGFQDPGDEAGQGAGLLGDQGGAG